MRSLKMPSAMRLSVSFCSLVSIAIFCNPAYAAVGDTLQAYLGYSYYSDDNFLRASSAQMTANPEQKFADIYRRADGGIIFSKNFSQQHLSADVNLNRTAFNRLTQLDNEGKDLHANWNWQLGNYLSGNLGTSYSQTLTPFTEFHNQELNLRTQRRHFWDWTWRVHPSWMVRGSLSRASLNYDLASQRTLDYVTKTTELGLDYLARTDSTAGILVRQTRGDYPNPQVSGSLVVDNSYIQNELLSKIDWRVTGKSRLQLLGGWVERQYKDYAGRDAKGPSARIIADWLPTGKVGMTLTAWRDFNAVDGLTANYSLNKGVSLLPTWDVTSKTRIEGLLKYEKNDYTGSSMYALPLPVSRIDTSRYASFKLSYKPIQNLEIGISAYRDQHLSSVAFADYRAKGMAINLRSQF